MTAVLVLLGAWVAASILAAAAWPLAKRAYLHSFGIRVGAPSEPMPPTPHQQIVQQVIRDHLEWRNFVQAHEWPGSCPHCVWWVPAPSEAEDAIAVYRPCPRHDPVLGDDMERRAE